jgi:predicted nuclease of predicted toxin-antitoxin system
MNFLVDANLPRRFCRVLESFGHVALHTLDLPQRNATSDHEIMRYADAHDYIVTTKDADFVDAILRSTDATQALADFNRKYKQLGA